MATSDPQVVGDHWLAPFIANDPSSSSSNGQGEEGGAAAEVAAAVQGRRRRSGGHKRQTLSIAEKQTLLDNFDAMPPNTSMTHAASQLGVKRTTLNNILRNRKEIQDSVGSKRKRKRAGHKPEVDVAVFQWMAEARENNVQLSTSVVKEKAKELAEMLGRPDFKASDGWLSRFKEREGLLSKTLQEAAEIQARAEWLGQTWPKFVEEYPEEDIWNASESGFYFRALPYAALAVDDDISMEDEKSQERVTALFCTSMTGEKKQPLLVGKSKSANFLRQVRKLPLEYDTNPSACMTEILFQNWAERWNEELRQSDKKVLLLLDNSKIHPQDLRLSQIRIVFLPPNVTSIAQPHDAGAVQQVKLFYRKKLLRSILNAMNDNISDVTAADVVKNVTLLDAIHILAPAWQEMRAESIRNSWRRSGMKIGEQEEVDGEIDMQGIPFEPEMFIEWAVQVDQDAPTVEDEGTEIKEEEEEDDDDDLPPPTADEMRAAMRTLKRGLQNYDFDFTMLYQFEVAVEGALNNGV